MSKSYKKVRNCLHHEDEEICSPFVSTEYKYYNNLCDDCTSGIEDYENIGTDGMETFLFGVFTQKTPRLFYSKKEGVNPHQNEEIYGFSRCVLDESIREVITKCGSFIQVLEVYREIKNNNDINKKLFNIVSRAYIGYNSKQIRYKLNTNLMSHRTTIGSFISPNKKYESLPDNMHSISLKGIKCPYDYMGALEKPKDIRVIHDNLPVSSELLQG